VNKLDIFITTTATVNPIPIDFYDIKKIPDPVTAVILIWDHNSYVINVAEKFFVINGGRVVVPEFLKSIDKPKLSYCMRRRASVDLGGEVEEGGVNLSDRAFTSYLFGVDSEEGSSPWATHLEISDDGKFWRFVGKRK